ncbi:MAG TPA: 30S ribosomal protein S6e, partial [Pyrodictium sp.]|nr:30S ribosomal protein S6e [Pyrodictium sp.]
MVEFKIVVGDPRSHALDPIVKVKAKGLPDINLSAEEKERKRLPVCKASRKLLEKLRAELGIITLRFRKDDKKVNITCRAVIDDNVPEDEVHLSLELIGEKIGAEEAEAEAFRAKTWQITVTSPQADQLIGL